MNINKIPMLTKVKAMTLGVLLCGSTVMCNHSKNEYVKTLKNSVKENVAPEVYQSYEEQSAKFGANEAKVFKNAYDSIKSADRNYFEGFQNVRSFE